MLPPLPDPLPHFDPPFAPLPPPQQHLLIDDRNHPDGFLAHTPNQPHAPHLDIRIKTHYLGRMNTRCEHCNALHWLEERVLYMGSQLNPKFGLCCDHGRVNLPSPPSPPLELLDLFKDNSSVGKEFRENIRRYNSAFAFISLGCKLNAGMERSGGPYSFRVDGELYHMVGSLLPEPGDPPSYAQLYFYDPLEALEYRMANIHNRNLNRHTMQALQVILTNCNPYIQLYKSAREILEEQPNHSNLTLRLHFDATKDQRCYNAPTSTEVAALLLGPADQPYDKRDIILYLRGGGVCRIDEGSPYYTPLHYVLLFPKGDFGWHWSMRLQPGRSGRHQRRREEEEEENEIENDSENEREGDQASGRLLQQYVVDAWAQIEQSYLSWLQFNQNKLRAEVYNGLADALQSGDASLDNIGRRLVLPSSHIGSPQNMQQLYQDSMAICRKYIKPKWFVTATTNPAWKEITDELLPGQTPSDRPDLISRVFTMKMKHLRSRIINGKVLGKVVAFVGHIEFQKCGLPHEHSVKY
ncbi:hypothetical protein M422DRAFT_183878 [Sphaerobolus stellatus SS14]|uniref:Helitron helicase-like domain-containing protein n=1 Tax=Sphaerobolus stellatus (strain SS14) TaxID=990650 RepID=A0A0C9UDW0_SPHS4|nr:hypothetical protein M422DRAFT_183878 [Sphaerobolus stellatus SS14]